MKISSIKTQNGAWSGTDALVSALVIVRISLHTSVLLLEATG